MDSESKRIARHSLLLANCPDDLCDEILATAVVKTHDRGKLIFDHGQKAEYVYVVIDGWVKLFRVSQNGAEAVVGVFTKGRSFGEAVAFRHDTYPVSAEAVTDCRLLQIRSDQLLGMMHARPEICMAILSSTFAHLHSLVAQVEQLKAQTGAQRVAEFLLTLCPTEDGACTVTLPYDKILIAGRLGMKPESLSRAFARLRDIGVTVRQNHAAISDIERLRTYAANDPAEAWSKAL